MKERGRSNSWGKRGPDINSRKERGGFGKTFPKVRMIRFRGYGRERVGSQVGGGLLRNAKTTRVFWCGDHFPVNEMELFLFRGRAPEKITLQGNDSLVEVGWERGYGEDVVAKANNSILGSMPIFLEEDGMKTIEARSLEELEGVNRLNYFSVREGATFIGPGERTSGVDRQPPKLIIGARNLVKITAKEPWSCVVTREGLKIST
ncbi:hypothetical protein H5410_002582 [Solanum commersonii]|uniref:Uncharacterized protein n=1 Tax=Solanum commersonii TaxID=4109 RepID=A0A9J6B2C4_SOLCO|nr:hypothetical protein H5410_002582 [Solanum commersonii]